MGHRCHALCGKAQAGQPAISVAGQLVLIRVPLGSTAPLRMYQFQHLSVSSRRVHVIRHSLRWPSGTKLTLRQSSSLSFAHRLIHNSQPQPNPAKPSQAGESWRNSKGQDA